MVRFDEIKMCPSLARKWEVMQCDAQTVLRAAFEDAMNNPERVRSKASKRTKVGKYSGEIHTICIGYVTFVILVLRKCGEILIDLDLNDGEEIYVETSIDLARFGGVPFQPAEAMTANDNYDEEP